MIKIEDKYVSMVGLFATYSKVNKGKRRKVYYNEHMNNMILFTPYYKEDTEVDIINSTISGYSYLVKTLNENKNIIVDWSKVEGTTSDYIIYYDYDPSQFLKKSQREISYILFSDASKNPLPMTKFNEVRNCAMKTIPKEVF